MQANPMRSLYGFAKQREEEANGLTQILGQVLGQNADLSGGRQLQPQLATHTPASQQSNVPPKIAFAGFGPSDQNNFNSHSKHDAAMSNNQSYIRTPSAENDNALARSSAATDNAFMDSQKYLGGLMGGKYNPALAPDPAIDTTAQPEAVDALSEAQKNGWISSQTGASVAQRLGIAQPEAVDAATAPLMAPRAAAPENAKATIESILAGLGDNPEDAAKKAKNMSQGEMWLALGKGIGQIGKGQAVDISSVVQMRRQRLATSAAETKDVARRRAAASLVFEQSGDASMATAVGQGAISYSDFTTERQRKEVNARANAALVKEAQKNGIMAEIVGGMDFLSDEQKELYAKATKEGVDLTTLMKPYELEQAADAAALATAKLDEKEQQRDGAQKFYEESSVPVDQATARYLAQTDMSVKEARELALKDFPSTGGDTGISAQDAAANRASAQIIIDNPAATTIAKAAAEQVLTLDGYADTNAMLEAVSKSQPPAAPVDTTVVTPAMREANLAAAKVTLGSETSTPEARAVAQAVVAAEGGVSMADTLTAVKAGQTPTAPVDTTAVTPAMRQANLLAANVTLSSPTSTPQAIAVAQAVVAADGGVSMDDALTTVQSAQTPAAATTTDITNYNAYAADEIANGRTPLSRLAYEQAAKPTTSTNINVNTTDGEELPAAWAKAEQTLAQKGQAFKRIRNAAGQLEVYIGPEGLPEIITIPGGEISQTTAASAQEAVLQAQNAFANNGVSTSAIDQVVDSVLQPGVIRANTTVLSGITTRLGEVFNFPTDRSTLLTQVGVLNAQKTFETLEDLNAQGIKLTPVSNVDLTLAGQSRTTLAAAEKLTDKALREEVVRQYNLTMDVMGGPASNRRFDSKGVAYKPSVDTLGYSEEGFERNWKQLPERLRTQWLSGEITSFPEDGAFAAVGADMNQRVALYEAYNGDIENRAKVGASFDSAKFANELGLTVQEAQNLSYDEYNAFSDEDKALVDKIHDRFAR
jgi:hypothetical protein